MSTNILLVEDESIIALDIQLLLRRMGYNVSGIAASGQAALSSLETNPADLVLMDIRLQGNMDGIETAAHIHTCYDIPIIYLTAYADDVTLQRAKITEPFGYLLKPFEERELRIAIEIALYRHRSEHALRESEEQYRHLVNDAPDAILIIEQETIFLANEASARLLGTVTPSTLEGHALADFLVKASDLMPHVSPVGMATTRIVETDMVGIDGRIRPVECAIIPFLRQGRPAFQIIARDITLRRQALIEQERRHLQAILDTASESICLTDTYGNLQYANPATAHITGYSLTELRTRPILHWHKATMPAISLREAEIALQNGQPWHGETPSQRKDGTHYDIRWSFNPIYRPDGYVQGFVHVQTDITPLKELHRLKDQFASHIGHELRTPVTNMKLYLDLLERRPDRSQHYRQVLSHEVDRLERLIERFIEVSMINAESRPIEIAPFDLNQTVQDVFSDWQQRATRRNLKLNVELTAESVLALGHPVMVGKILTHLIENACLYTPAGGRVTVRTALAASSDPPGVMFSVQDTGPGLTTEEIPFIFQRFYRGTAANTYNVPGVGLGLAICQEIIQKLNGRIHITSTPGKGATFTVWLPPAAT